MITQQPLIAIFISNNLCKYAKEIDQMLLQATFNPESKLSIPNINEKVLIRIKYRRSGIFKRALYPKSAYITDGGATEENLIGIYRITPHILKDLQLQFELKPN
ncbi:hypothetical protein [Vibrio barjaei]|uniref:hypothetical protein n=1 Tax=Vibrio barjaei TaxID=1676683 RepID=UPI0022851342|nr:hypothetical protein [Vibrio barjaei]MCY9872947.1 hypothetical protein [Vibrio barjaei]